MRYYLLEGDHESEWEVLGSPPLPDGAQFLRGRPITVPMVEPVTAQVDHPAGEPPRALLEGVVPFFRADLLAVLLAQGATNLQSWRARLENRALGLVWNDYFAVNVVAMVDAVAMDRSRYDVWMGGGDVVPPLVEFAEVVLDARRIAGLRMFRVPQSPSLLFIDESLLDAIDASRPPGGWGVFATGVDTING